MKDLEVQNTIIDVSEKLSKDIYYFYAKPHSRDFLSESALFTIAGFLIGAFCQGFIDYIKGRIKELGKDTAKRLWESTQVFLGKDEKEQQIKLEKMLANTTSLANTSSKEELSKNLAITEKLLTLILVYNNIPEDKAILLANQIAKIIISKYMKVEI